MYRIKQFIWAVTSKFKRVDSEYINEFLNKQEKELFNKLSKDEMHHSIRVCKNALNIAKSKKYKDIENKKIGKVALLHDIGKVNGSLNIVEKSALVILNKVTNGNIKRYKNIKQVDIYYNHGKKGAEILKNIKSYDKDTIECIEYHHSNKTSDNKILNIIRESDNIS